MAAVQHVADRAAFWAELGAVSAPALLGRLGQSLEEAAAKDEELGAALRLAASHVRQRCLVWAADIQDAGSKGGHGAWCDSAAPPDPQLLAVTEDSEGFNNKSATALTPRAAYSKVGGESVAEPWLADNAGDSDGGSDSDSDTASSVASDGLFLVSSLVPCGCPAWALRLLPGVGAFASQVLWIIALAACIPAVIFHSGRHSVFGGMSSNLGTMVDTMLAMKLTIYMPLLVTTRCLVLDSAFNSEFRANMGSPRGPETLRFIRRWMAVCVAVMAFSSVLEACRFGYEGLSLYSKFVFVRYCVFLVCSSVFFTLVKLSLDKVKHLRDLVAEPEPNAQFWNDATREYVATCRTIDRMWRSTGYSTSVSVLLAFDAIFAAVFGAIGCAEVVVSGRITSWRPWCWAVKQLAIVCTILYFIASIHSMSSSARNAKRSLLYVARQHLGKMKPWCLHEHFAFLHCVEGVPCGVEVAILPVLTMEFIAPMVKVAFGVAPVLAGYAFTMAQRKLVAGG